MAPVTQLLESFFGLSNGILTKTAILEVLVLVVNDSRALE